MLFAANLRHKSIQKVNIGGFRGNAHFALFQTKTAFFTAKSGNSENPVPQQAKPAARNPVSWRMSQSTTSHDAPEGQTATKAAKRTLFSTFDRKGFMKKVDQIPENRKIEATRQRIVSEMQQRLSNPRVSLGVMREKYGDLFIAQLIALYVLGFVTSLYFVHLRGWLQLGTPLGWMGLAWVYQDYQLVCDCITAFFVNECCEVLRFPVLLFLHVLIRS